MPVENIKVPAPTHKAGQKPNGDGRKVNYLGIREILEYKLTWEWLVEGAVLKGRLYQIHGNWKAGKSLVAINLALHLAQGLEWCGRRLEKCLVVYVAGEAADDIIARIQAHALRHGIQDNGFFWLRPKPVYLTEQEHAIALAAEIEAFKADHEGVPVFVVIDTLARNFGPGRSESSDVDMGAFANNLIDIVIRPTDATGMIVHHQGHADKTRSRGHSSLPAAVDGTMSVEKREGVVLLNVRESRNTSGGDAFAFRIEGIDLGIADNFDNPINAPVLMSMDEGEARTEIRKAAEPEFTGHKATINRLVLEQAASQARNLKAQGYEVPEHIAVDIEQIKEAFYTEAGDDSGRHRKAWFNSKDAISERYRATAGNYLVPSESVL